MIFVIMRELHKNLPSNVKCSIFFRAHGFAEREGKVLLSITLKSLGRGRIVMGFTGSEGKWSPNVALSVPCISEVRKMRHREVWAPFASPACSVTVRWG